MRKIREILRLRWSSNLSFHKIAESLGISSSTAREFVHRAEGIGLAWPLPDELDDAALEELLYPKAAPQKEKPEPDWSQVHSELKRKGVTLTLLWHEYKTENPDGYQLSQFCHHYQQWRRKLKLSMKQQHRAGEKAFCDFAGGKLPVTDPVTGEVRFAHIFVSALGASSFTYADAFFSENTEAWCSGQAAAFEYFGGATEVIVPDNPKAVISQACWYEPTVNTSFADMATHYGAAVLPARVRHPKDKAVVESAVGVVTRWIIARLRNRTFFSLLELRTAIHELLDDLNNRPLKRHPGESRRSLWEKIDRPALKALPVQPYEYAEYRKRRVNIDYHVEVDGHFYSVPHQLVKEEVDVRVTASTIEVLQKGRRVASHARRAAVGAHTTIAAHMPKAHRQYAELSPSKLIAWATSIGSATQEVVEQILNTRLHPEQGYRRCIGILQLAKRNGNDRLEAACQRALASGALSYKSINSILKHGLDRRPLSKDERPSQLRIEHNNIRGASYFTSKEEADCATRTDDTDHAGIEASRHGPCA